MAWLEGHLGQSVTPFLDAPIDTTIKPLYGRQEGALVSYNPHKPGRPSHSRPGQQKLPDGLPPGGSRAWWAATTPSATIR